MSVADKDLSAIENDTTAAWGKKYMITARINGVSRIDTN
jgi:hypothetical protein